MAAKRHKRDEIRDSWPANHANGANQANERFPIRVIRVIRGHFSRDLFPFVPFAPFCGHLPAPSKIPRVAIEFIDLENRPPWVRFAARYECAQITAESSYCDWTALLCLHWPAHCPRAALLAGARIRNAYRRSAAAAAQGRRPASPSCHTSIGGAQGGSSGSSFHTRPPNPGAFARGDTTAVALSSGCDSPASAPAAQADHGAVAHAGLRQCHQDGS
ncbi:hypothetical protein CfE428DRAFT_1103 [Chthoniobacter flavus Ellin428]|uniref:Uncharacterized protein n=1 Tax=Chthoniobacter flavus Ellin428 TaxID=497964 RepID=B4CWR5_9BACT|nr:hypothetical protein CfE428DRAFT_1103 [Chthoniobacter flavus Ellin428]TCO95781.1 hypothetical protein EV701_101472 [Chthoniobacter flavus]